MTALLAMNEPAQGSSNGAKTLAALQNLNWPTVALIILSGGGNLIFSQHKAQKLTYEQEEALHKIRQLHDSMDNFEDGIRSSLNNQAQILNGQSQIMSDHKELLSAIQRNQEALKARVGLEP